MTRAQPHVVPAPREAGFTLIEMLVALVIFAIISAAGVMMLRASLDAQASVSMRLADTSGLMRLRALLAAELMSAQPRPVRNSAGQQEAALRGDANSLSFSFAGDGTQGGVGRATYAIEEGNLVRRSATYADGAAAGPAAILVRKVAAVTWRYRGANGDWADGWAPDRIDHLPRAVEMTLTRPNSPPVTMAFLLGPDGLPQPGAQPVPSTPGASTPQPPTGQVPVT